MKIQKVLEETIRVRLNPRRPLHFARTKFFIYTLLGQWVENCRGLLIFYVFENSHYLCIMNIQTFQIDFDMELYSNFLSYSKFMGDTRSMHFILPCSSRLLTCMMIFESKQELIEMKRKLEQNFYKVDKSEQLQFFSRPEVEELVKAAEIKDEDLEYKLRFRSEVEAEIKQYLQEIEQLDRTTKNSGFKAYGLGREEWKFEQNEKEFIKEKKKAEVIANLIIHNKQSKLQ